MPRGIELSFAQKVGYASGNLGKSVAWSSVDYLLLFFLTDIWGIAPSVAGAIILAGLVWDGITDPIVGYFADRSKTRFGKYGLFLLIGAPLCGASLWLLFYNPGIDDANIGVYALATGLVFRTCYKICDVPHNALLARISDSSRDRSLISGLRFFFSSAGSLCVAFGAAYVFGSTSIDEQASRFSAMSILCGATYFIAIYVAYASTHQIDKDLPNRSQLVTPAESLSVLLQNRQILILYFVALVQAITIPMFAKGIVYFAKYEMNDETWVAQALIALTLGQGLSMPLWIWLSRIISKRDALWLAYLLVAISLLLFFALSPKFNALRLPLVVSFGVAVGGVNMLIWAMLPDLVDFGEIRFGKRVEALAFGFFTLFLKCGVGLGTGLFGVLLAYANYQPNSGQSALFGDMLLLTMCALPVVGVAVCALALSRYMVNHHVHAEIRERLAA